MLKNLMLVAAGLALVSAPAFAKRHCVDKDGAEIDLKDAKGKEARKACKAAGGKMKKMHAGATANHADKTDAAKPADAPAAADPK